MRELRPPPWLSPSGGDLVGAVALAWHFRLVRADRAALAAAGLEETYHVTLLVKAADRAAAQARVTAALAGQADITVRG